jgi:hypothetical protein
MLVLGCALFDFRACTLAEEAVIFTHGRQVRHFLIKADHRPPHRKRAQKRSLSIHDLTLTEILPGQAIEVQSEMCQFSTASAHAIYAFYRMAPRSAREYDSRR